MNYTQYAHKYYVKKKTFILDAISRLTPQKKYLYLFFEQTIVETNVAFQNKRFGL